MLKIFSINPNIVFAFFNSRNYFSFHLNIFTYFGSLFYNPDILILFYGRTRNCQTPVFLRCPQRI